MRRRYVARVFIAVLLASAPCAFSAGCNGKTAADAPDAVAGADAGDAGEVDAATAEASCSLVGNACTGALECCPPRGAFLYDPQRKCHAATKTAFHCHPVPPKPSPPAPKGQCGFSIDESICLKRLNDGGDGEAGVEIYVSPDGMFSGFTDCDDEQTNADALSSSRCP